jgi:hypothetical protein
MDVQQLDLFSYQPSAHRPGATAPEPTWIVRSTAEKMLRLQGARLLRFTDQAGAQIEIAATLIRQFIKAGAPTTEYLISVQREPHTYVSKDKYVWPKSPGTTWRTQVDALGRWVVEEETTIPAATAIRIQYRQGTMKGQAIFRHGAGLPEDVGYKAQAKRQWFEEAAVRITL